MKDHQIILITPQYSNVCYILKRRKYRSSERNIKHDKFRKNVTKIWSIDEVSEDSNNILTRKKTI